ncbi:MAG: SusC/RagA family TonB-linked outer membrane protein [Gemmatimonadota bacterium]
MKQNFLRAALVLLGLATFASTADAQDRTIRGTVVDSASATPVSGVSVQVQGTEIGALTDGDGSFVLRNAPAGEVTLEVRRIGFRTIEVAVGAGQDDVEIELRRDYLQVDDLVVTGRATQVERQNLAHSVSSISGEEVNETPQQTLDLAVQGKFPGAVVSKNSGAPGGGVQVRMRGITTINAGSQPLYVVDGVIVSNESIANGINAITESAGGSNASNQDDPVNRIADLNSRDIESIEVLKGPSAAAIYGSKAANGVVIIETSSGTSGAPQVRTSFRGGFFDLANKIGARRFESADEAAGVFGSDGAEAFEANDGQFFDHEEELAGRNDVSWEGSANVRGGGDDTRYYASGLWKNDEGIIANTGLEKQSGRVNLSQDLGDRLTADVSANLIHSETGRGLTNNDNSQTSYYMTLQGVPSFIDLTPNADGEFPDTEPFLGNGSNPLQTAELLTNDEEVWRGIGSVNLQWQAVDQGQHDLDFNFTSGIDFFNQENDVTSPPELHFEDDDGFPGTSLLANTDNTNLNASLNGIWAYDLGGAELTTSAGASYFREDRNINRIISRSLLAGQDNVDVGNQINIFENKLQIEDFGFYLQEELLAMDERLLVTGALRAEQTSVAADTEKLFLYPKASASFRFPDLGGALDEVKLRAAFGQTGNRPNFGQKFTSLATTQKTAGLPGLVIQGNFALGQDLEPERQTEVEGGVDLTAWDGRARLETTGYVQFIDELIQVQQLAGSTGFNTRTFNGGEIRNWGFEALLGVTPVETGDFRWTSRMTFDLNRSEVTDLPIPSFTAAGFGADLGQFQIEEGESPTQIVGLNTEGELEQLGDSRPDFNATVSQEIRWNDFRLFGQGEWRQGQDVINLTELLYDASQNSPDFVPPGDEPRDVEECHPDCAGLERLLGFVAGTPRGYVQPASFFKLRELSLSYDVPNPGSIWGALSSLRLTASARDLVRITDYRGLDPEVSNFGTQGVGRSIDVAPFPPSRSFWLGVDLTF